MPIATVVLDVPSAIEWVPTNVLVRANDRLAFSATGTWKDWFINCDADGYDGRILYFIGRPPRIDDSGRYFRLMGRILSDNEPRVDDPSKTFAIGRAAAISADRSGLLYVFANDRLGYYGNNSGQVRLTIELTRN